MIADTQTPIYILVLGIVFAPLLTYLVAARRLSGKIKDSEATQLWEESRSIRDWSTARTEKLTEELDELRIRVNALEVKNGELGSEIRQLTEDKFHLKNLLEQEKRFNAQLRWDAEHSPRRRRFDSQFTDVEGENPSDSA